ncbi:RnfABCDGE type electron transport complex subunit D [Bacillus haynesii]|uniref:RnfABCDGE type electron transport complex subunit D n=1 Tax=Bacillus haynesii TaxID=1925021 RepID=UPI0022815179|nr:RnfABCDGE type electron transport complex subunit D [Bacillus haynesii]MCY9373534.1 RnfABCDGE type electron transport complex subunit D [Bacillus haynesii]
MDKRIKALRRFALAITILNILGHTWLSFEQSIAQLLTALTTCYILEILFEVISAKLQKRDIVFKSGIKNSIDFLLPAHITGLAIGMLIYSNSNILPYVFAAAVAVSSKEIFKVTIKGKEKHFLNPSNTGIAVVLLLFPWVGISPPYQFTENVSGSLDWVIPGIILFTGTLLNTALTGKIPLILAWGGVFVIQAVVRSWWFGSENLATLFPLTGMSFMLFTFYMITDPGTTPSSKKGQFIFGGSVAALYGLYASLGIVFTFFFALVTVCITRGVCIALGNAYAALNEEKSKITANELEVTKEASV